MSNKQGKVLLSTETKPKVFFIGFSRRTYLAALEHFKGHHVDEANGISSFRKKVKENPADVIFVNTCTLGDEAALVAHQLQGRQNVSTIAVYGGERGRNYKKLERRGPVFVSIENVLSGNFPEALNERLAA